MVDVWVTPKVSAVAGTKVKAAPVLTEVVVVAVPRTSARAGPADDAAGDRRGARTTAPASSAAALGGMADGRVVIARKG